MTVHVIRMDDSDHLVIIGNKLHISDDLTVHNSIGSLKEHRDRIQAGDLRRRVDLQMAYMHIRCKLISLRPDDELVRRYGSEGHDIRAVRPGRISRGSPRGAAGSLAGSICPDAQQSRRQYQHQQKR